MTGTARAVPVIYLRYSISPKPRKLFLKSSLEIGR